MFKRNFKVDRRTRRPVARPASVRPFEALETRTMFNANYFDLNAGGGTTFSQNWTGTDSLIANDDWTNIPSIVGYQGNAVSPSTAGTDPQLCTNDDASVVDVIKPSSTSNTAGGVHNIANDVIGLKGSSTANAPYLRLHLNTTLRRNIVVAYNLRELTSSTVDQRFALQYRVGASGVWTNVAAGATGGFTTAGMQTVPMSVTLPAVCNGQAQLQVRIMTHDAVGTDAMVGVDDIVVTSDADTTRTMGFAVATSSIAENGGTLQVHVTRGPNTTGVSTVDYAFADLTANNGPDYTGVNGTITFNDTESDKTINVPIINDGTIEPKQTFSITLSNPTGTNAALGGITTHTVTITDDDKTTAGKPLASGALTQDWSNTAQITTDDDWSGVPYITGYRGDDLTTAVGADPQTVLGDGNATPVYVSANKDGTFYATHGAGIAEIDGIANPVVTLNGSSNADAPFLQFSVDTTGVSSVDVSYNLRDVDDTTDNVAQAVALQYRVGNSGTFTNVPAAYVADATDGPSIAGRVTPVAVTVTDPAIANQALVQFRVMTTNATGSPDEYVGVDDIVIAKTPSAAPAWITGSYSWTPGTQQLTVTGTATIIDDPKSYGDAPIITVDGASGNLLIDPSVSSPGFAAPVAAASAAPVTTASATAPSLTGSKSSWKSAATKSAAPRLFTTTATSSRTASDLPGTSASAPALNVHIGGLTVTNGAHVTLVSLGGARTATNHRILVIKANTLTVDASSKLDLTDNDLMLDYTGSPSPAAAVEGLVGTAFATGDWSGSGITSSVAGNVNTNGNYALAVADNASLTTPFGSDPIGGVNPMFDGEAVDSTAVLVKFSHRVDLNLDGKITSNDAAAFNSNYTGNATGAKWVTGDLDYNGTWTSNDAAKFNSFYQESLPAI